MKEYINALNIARTINSLLSILSLGAQIARLKSALYFKEDFQGVEMTGNMARGLTHQVIGSLRNDQKKKQHITPLPPNPHPWKALCWIEHLTINDI